MSEQVFILAGMPAILPFKVPLEEAGSEPLSRQIHALWVVGITLLVMAKIVQVSWNSLAGDIQKLPRLGYLKSLGISVLWGLAMVLVLAMISGTREALTPIAWVQEGWTYRLADENGVEVMKYRNERQQHLLAVYNQLKLYADEQGSFPEKLDDVPELDATIPGTVSLPPIYTPLGDSEFILMEPEIDSIRFAVTRNGSLVER